jgi:FAD-dependent oxidoreductase
MGFIWWILGIIHILPLFIDLIHGLTPQSPIQCNQTICTLKNSYGTWNDRKNCYAINVTYPTTEEQLRLAVSYVVQNNLKAKIVTKFSHTIPTLSCPQQNKNNAFFISTEKYDSEIQIDATNLAVTVDSGVKLRQLIDEVEKNGFSLVAAPYWEGVTIGGVISTGAHGSSWWGKGGAFHDYVLGINIVVPGSKSEGYAKILKLDAHDQRFNAAKVSLGVLGAISKVKFVLYTFNFFSFNQYLSLSLMNMLRQYKFYTNV